MKPFPGFSKKRNRGCGVVANSVTSGFASVSSGAAGQIRFHRREAETAGLSGRALRGQLGIILKFWGAPAGSRPSHSAAGGLQREDPRGARRGTNRVDP